jgi:exopolyphosphatase
VVVGNQASDADSIITAICMAYLTAHRLADPGTIVLPLVQCPRADYSLRAETVSLLRSVGIGDELLVFGGNATDDALSDNDMRRLHAEKRLRLTLVDHNTMTPRQTSLGLPSAVVCIVDHHKDDGASPHVNGDMRTIGYGAKAGLAADSAMGSCCTLVAQKILRDAPDLFRDEPLLGKLLLAGILIDTSNLGDQSKTQLLDISTVKSLYDACPKNSLPAQDAFYKKLAADKFDPEYWASVPPRDLLRADYKQYAEGGMNYGISSTLVSIEKIAATEEGGRDLTDALATLAATKGLDMLMMMSFSKDPDVTPQPGFDGHRQMLLYCSSPGLAPKLSYYLESLEELNLQPLPSQHLPAGGEVLVYEQLGMTASRKKLAPMLQAFFTLPYSENP